MTQITLTPEQEALAKRNWELRRGPASYAEDIMGPAPSPEVRAEMEEMLRRDPQSTTADYDEWCRLREVNVDASKQYQWLPPEEYANEEMRIGRVLHSEQFLTMLCEQCKLRAWYGDPAKCVLKGDSEEDAQAFGYESREQMADAGWKVKEDRLPQEGARWLGLQVQPHTNAPVQYVCGVQAGFMAEYEVIYFNAYGLALNSKYRGWRTVLLRLILKGLLEEDLAHQVFGRAEAPCAARYNQTLYAWRNRPRQETAGMANVPVVANAAPETSVAETSEPEPEPCAECGRRIGHNLDCSQHESFAGVQ